jgi:hypothetical protein
LLRSAPIGIALVLLTLRGLRPIHPPALEWFMPLALAYGAIVDGVHGVASPSGSRRPNRRGA